MSVVFVVETTAMQLYWTHRTDILLYRLVYAEQIIWKNTTPILKKPKEWQVYQDHFPFYSEPQYVKGNGGPSQRLVKTMSSTVFPANLIYNIWQLTTPEYAPSKLF